MPLAAARTASPHSHAALACGNPSSTPRHLPFRRPRPRISSPPAVLHSRQHPSCRMPPSSRPRGLSAGCLFHRAARQRDAAESPFAPRGVVHGRAERTKAVLGATPRSSVRCLLSSLGPCEQPPHAALSLRGEIIPVCLRFEAGIRTCMNTVRTFTTTATFPVMARNIGTDLQSPKQLASTFEASGVTGRR